MNLYSPSQIACSYNHAGNIHTNVFGYTKTHV